MMVDDSPYIEEHPIDDQARAMILKLVQLADGTDELMTSPECDAEDILYVLEDGIEELAQDLETLRTLVADYVAHRNRDAVIL